MFKKLLKKESGFTLIELLIVVAIIAILAAIAIPQFSKYKQRGYKAGLTSDIKNAYTASMAYLTDKVDGTVTTLAILQQYGYQTSAGISFVSANLDGAGAGFIQLKQTLLKTAPQNSANVTADGSIKYF